MSEKIILHVMVVGFHHKKGCQVEYIHPPISRDFASDGSELPEAWKNLPNLALPDGAHNYESDYVYFILPAIDGGKESVYGISCYRQIDALELENRTPDITRGSVQKSVVVLSSLPLYGAIRTRLELITHAYFDGKDFSKVDLLLDTYTSLNNCMTPSAMESQLNCDLSVRELLLTYKHDLLVLFKLMLLERRLVMYHSPASELTSRMLTLISLLPGFLKGGGLQYATYVAPLKMTSVDSFVDIRTSGPSPPTTPTKESVAASAAAAVPSVAPAEPATAPVTEMDSDSELALNLDSARLEIRSSAVASGENSPSGRSNSPADSKEQVDETGGTPSRRLRAFKSLTTNMSAASVFLRVKLASAASSASSAVTAVASRSRTSAGPQAAADSGSGSGSQQNLGAPEEPVGMGGDLAHFDDPRTETDEFGMPLPVFSPSHLFIPYVSLHNLDILENPAVRAYFIGANNMLYMQKKNLVDCFIGSTGSEMWVNDPELKRAIQLTSADLRFIDCLINTVMATVPSSNSTNLEDQQQQQEDVFENTAPSRHRIFRHKKKRKKYISSLNKGSLPDWDGSDEWLRLQFREYLLSMLKMASDSDGSKSASPSATQQNLSAAQESNPQEATSTPADAAKDPAADSPTNGIIAEADNNNEADNKGENKAAEGGDGETPAASTAVGNSGDFNTTYLRLLRATRHYRVWRAHLTEYIGFQEVAAIHPAHGQWKFDDLQLRINHLLSHSEQGRKINNAVQNTGKIVQETGKAVGSAITNARSAVSSLWTGISKTATNRFSRGGANAGTNGDASKNEAAPEIAVVAAEDTITESDNREIPADGDQVQVADGGDSAALIIS